MEGADESTELWRHPFLSFLRSSFYQLSCCVCNSPDLCSSHGSKRESESNVFLPLFSLCLDKKKVNHSQKAKLGKAFGAVMEEDSCSRRGGFESEERILNGHICINLL